MNNIENTNNLSDKMEKSHGLRIGLALLFTIALVWFFIPEEKEKDELAILARKGDWEKLVETSDDYIAKEQSAKAFYYKAKGHFQLFKASKERENEVAEAIKVLEVVKTCKQKFDNAEDTEYQFALHPMMIGIEHYFYYLQLKGDTANLNLLRATANGVFDVNLSSEVELIQTKIVDQAYQLIGVPYASGGTTPAQGFDCSGFTRYLFKQQGMTLPHGAFLQINKGVEIKKNEANKGDLIFFSEDTTVNHVGLVVGKSTNGLMVVHASNKGVEEMDESSPEWVDYWGEKKVTIKRLLVD